MNDSSEIEGDEDAARGEPVGVCSRCGRYGGWHFLGFRWVGPWDQMRAVCEECQG